MKKLLLQATIWSAALLLIASCQKVSSLSDSANVTNIAVVGSDPAKAIFGEPTIKGHEIDIPLVYGKYLFPMVVTFEVQVDEGCTQLLGLEAGNTLQFDELGYARKIYTVAASGATTTWMVRLVDGMSNESAEVLRGGATAPTGSTTMIAPTAIVNQFNATVTFQAMGAASYPLTIIPSITLAEGADFIEEFPAEITFDSADDEAIFTVESASGRTKKWTFTSAVVSPKDNSETSKLSEDQVRRLTPEVDKITFTSESVRLSESAARFKVSSTVGGQIDLMIAPAATKGTTFPLTAQITIPVDRQSTIFGAPANNTYTFESYTDKHEVWIADNASGIVKCWIVAINPEMKTDIIKYEIGTFTCKNENIEVDKDNMVIDPINSRIVIPVADKRGTAIPLKENLTLKINMTLEVSEGATCTSKVTSHTYITNSAALSVSTQNGLIKRAWTVYLKDTNAEISADKTISNMTIIDYSSRGNLMSFKNLNAVANNDTKTITFDISAGIDAFPLTISKKIFKTKEGTTTILPATIADYQAPIVFESLSSVVEFSAQAEDGTTDNWKIVLTSSATGKSAEIKSMLITDASNEAQPSDIIFDEQTRHISILINGTPPFDFRAQFTTSESAKISGIENGILSFATYNDRIPVTVTSQDGTTTNTWTIGIERPEKIQLGNSDFEQWGTFKDINGGTFTIDPTPGAGYGWASANLIMLGIGVQGTKPVDRTDGTTGAEMTTSEQNTIIKGYLVASGTLFTGRFNLDLNYLDQPRKMTKFGVPFSARPSSFDMEVRYTPGAQMKEARLEGSKYVIYDIDGVDKAHIWIELVCWTGEGSIDYDGNPSDKIIVLGRSELVIDGEPSKNPYKEWSQINMPMVYNTQHKDLKPTHLVAVFSSSKEGDKFRGAIGSKLGTDNFEIKY